MTLKWLVHLCFLQDSVGNPFFVLVQAMLMELHVEYAVFKAQCKKSTTALVIAHMKKIGSNKMRIFKHFVFSKQSRLIQQKNDNTYFNI